MESACRQLPVSDCDVCGKARCLLRAACGGHPAAFACHFHGPVEPQIRVRRVARRTVGLVGKKNRDFVHFPSRRDDRVDVPISSPLRARSLACSISLARDA